ncbi:MAG: transposase [Microcoleus sp. SIO2G3]|nr:transposase [Microcoleus sp. SIO2G3]
MNFNPQKHHRRSIRLKGYDYALPGAYFVTICTYQRQCWFGEILDGQMYLNQIGNVVVQEWMRSFQIRPGMKLDQWIIMPNHLHGLIILTDTVGAHSCAPLPKPLSNPVPPHRQPRSLSSFIAQFKSTVTKRINIICQAPGIPMWQRNYYESIIPDEESLHTIRQYIINNPQCWADDPENPQHYPENQQLLIDLPF